MAYLPLFHPRNSHSTNATRPKSPQERKALQSCPASQEKKRSLDIPQRIERRLARLDASKSVYQRWLVELISLGISAFCMAWIIAILIYIQDKRPSKWPFGNVQTHITVLAKIAAAALIIPTSEAIGQLKWNWFSGKTSREIYDFEIFDQASRGPWGSFMLLIRTKGRSLAALGAALTLLMLAIDTFFQQVVLLPQRWEEYSPVGIRRVTYYEPRSRPYTVAGLDIINVDEDMTAVVNKFLFDNGTQLDTSGNGTQAEIPVTCPTSYCTWPKHQTLGVCSACEDVSQLLTFACLSSRIDWASNVSDTEQTQPGESTISNGTVCGYFINATSATPVLMSGYSIDQNSQEALLMRALPLVTLPDRVRLFGGSSINFKHIRYPVVDFIVSSTPGGAENVYRNETPIAYECLLYWCVKNINASSYGAYYREDTFSTFTNTTPIADPWIVEEGVHPKLGPYTEFFYREDIMINTPSELSGSEYGLSNNSHVSTMGTLDTILPSFTTVQNATAEPEMRHDLFKINPRLRVLPINPWLQARDIPRHMERLASAMSNVMRTTASDDVVEGKSYTIETYVSVRWGWITYPLALLVFSLVFLIATIRKTSRGENEMGVWKTSAMPTLIYGLPKATQESLRSDNSAWGNAGLEGGKTRIKLGTKGWRVSGCASAPTTPVSKRNQPPPGWI